MRTIYKPVTITALLLLIVPAVFYAVHWQWQLDQQNQLTYWLFLATQTVSSPWGMVTCIVLGLLLVVLFCERRYFFKQAILLLLVMGIAILAGQGIKNIIKDQVQEIRPYMVWLGKNNQIYPDKFYQLSKKERETTLQAVLSINNHIPLWQQRYWSKDSNYAFPSAHTIFAVTWALLAVGLLWYKKQRLIASVIVIWSAIIMVSRLALGMHWPQDLAMGVVLSWIITLVFLALFQYGNAKIMRRSTTNKAVKKSDAGLVSE